MKTKNYIVSLLILMMSISMIVSCYPGKGDMRNKNLEQATFARLDSVSGIQYMGMSDTHELDGDKLQTVIIYYVTDSVGKHTEYNVRVTANEDCSEIYSWEKIDTNVLSNVKQKINDKLKEKASGLECELIDAIINLRKL